MMKKTITLGIFLLISSSLIGQKVFVKLGGNYTKFQEVNGMSNSFTPYTYNYDYGYQFGIGLDIDFLKILSIETGINFTQINSEYSRPYRPDPPNISEELTSDFIKLKGFELPLNLKINFYSKEKIRLFVKTGIVGMLLTEAKKNTNYDIPWFPFEQPTPPPDINTVLEYEIGGDLLEKYHLGGSTGLGVVYRGFLLEFNYDFSYIQVHRDLIFDNEFDRQIGSMFRINLGYYIISK